MAEPDIDVRGSRVLVVDDTPANLEVLSLALEDAGYQVMFADAGAVALDLAARFEPALILLDVNMPGMDGFEVCRRGASITSSSPSARRRSWRVCARSWRGCSCWARWWRRTRSWRRRTAPSRRRSSGGSGQQTDPIPLVPQTLGHQLAGVVLDFNQVDVHG